MDNNEALTDIINRVFITQRFAVLTTQSGGQPYCNLVAFAEVDKLGSLLFVTGRDTRKYANAQSNEKVALLIDSRTNQPSDFQSAVAITVLGTIKEVDRGKKAYLSEIYIAKHPQLEDFLNLPSNALMEVRVSGYVVAKFDGASYLPMEKRGDSA